MSEPGKEYLSFDPKPRKPKEAPPPNTCDCQFHISGDERYKTREGAAYKSEGATYVAARRMLKDPSDRKALNVEWVKMFPDPKQRPARMVMPQLGDADALILCDVTAVA